MIPHDIDVLVAAARDVHDQQRSLLHPRRELLGVGDRVRALERRHDALLARQLPVAGDRFLVGYRYVLGAAAVLDSGRAEYVSVSDKEAVAGYRQLSLSAACSGPTPG